MTEATNTVIRTWKSRGGKYKACLVRNDFPGCTAAQSTLGHALAPRSTYYMDDYTRTAGKNQDYSSTGRMFVCMAEKGEEHALMLAERMLSVYPSPMRIEG
jgi:hypothetical protein